MNKDYKLHIIISTGLSLILTVALFLAVANFSRGTWRLLSLVFLSLSLLFDLYLLWQVSVKSSAISRNFFLLVILITPLCFAIPFLHQRVQSLSLLVWLTFGLFALWKIVQILILREINNPPNRFMLFGEVSIDPANLLLLGFSVFIFTPILYELYQRIDYQMQRQSAIDSAMEIDNIRFDLYARLFQSIDEPLLKFVHYPNVSLLFQDPETDYYQMSVQTNSLGFRDTEFQPEEISDDDFVVLFLGDSVTFGVGVESEETFVEQSEFLLSEYFQWQGSNAKVWHINMGVGSYGLIESVEALKYANALQFKPDVVVYSYNINDYSARVRGLDQETGALVPFKPRSFLIWDLRRMFQPQSVNLILSQKLDELVDLTDAWGVELIINVLPAEPQPNEFPSAFNYEGFYRDSYAFIKKYIADNQLTSVDGLSIFKEESENEYLFVRPSFKDDGNHYNQLGHSLMGKMLSVALIESLTPQPSSSLFQSLEDWGDYYLENQQFSRAKTIYDILLEESDGQSFTFSASLPLKNDKAIKEDLIENATLLLDFSSDTTTQVFTFESKIPEGWDWQVLPECAQTDCSVTTCIDSSCQFKDDNLGLYVSDVSSLYQDFPATGLDGPAGTIAFWYRPDQTSVDAPVARLLWSYWRDADNRAYINLNSDEGLVAGFKTTQWQTVAAPINWQKDEWHHVALTWDAEFPTVKLFIDGQLAAHSFEVLDLPQTDGREAIGVWAHNGSFPANGYFSEVLIFPNTLPAADIVWIYENSFVNN